MAYSPALALKCARMSDDVYAISDSEALRDDPNQKFFEIDETQVWLVNEPDAVFVVFRGTDSYDDFLTDIRATRNDTDFGEVHKGFLHYTLNTLMEVGVNVLIWAGIKSKPVILTGHSLGGAAAVLEACFLYQAGFKIGGVYTFGAPRVGNAQFAKYCDDAFGDVHFRHVNGLDGVPWTPFWHWGYRHCGKRFYFSTKRQALVRNAPLCQMVIERLPIFITRPWKWGLNKRLDHPVALYVEGCERNLEV